MSLPLMKKNPNNAYRLGANRTKNLNVKYLYTCIKMLLNYT